MALRTLLMCALPLVADAGASHHLIVTYRSSFTRQGRRELLEEALAAPWPARWKIVARPNPGWRLDVPSDFSLLAAPDAVLLSLRRRLVHHSDVVRVTPERSYRSSAAQSAAESVGAAGCGGAARSAEKHSAATSSPRHAACGSRRVLHVGRRKSRFAAFERGTNNGSAAEPPPQQPPRRRRRRLASAGDKGAEIARTLRADVLWQKGHKGEGVRVAVFDTGLGKNHVNFDSVEERSNWTDEDTLEDKIGHGSFVAGCIGASSTQCPGLAPKAALLTMKVFTNDQRR